MSLNVNIVAKYLIRCHWNEILSIKICFTFMQKEKIRALGKLLKLVLDICFLQRLNLAFCVGTFIKNVRLGLMILTLPLNKKSSFEMLYKQTVRRFSIIQRLFLFYACGICLGLEKNVAKYSFIDK